jgi:hypothetical protein
VEYKTTATSPHGLEEERQWARILSAGNPAAGMALVFIQKLCTAFHELDPAWTKGLLDERALGHFRDRLAGRARRVLETLESNDLGAIDGVAELRRLLCTIETAETVGELAGLAEEIHAVNHTLCDSLERGEYA